MADIQTKVNDASVLEFINNVPDERKRQDSLTVMEMMREVTGLEPKMWGPAIIGYGSYHYKYESGREGDMPMIGFSPRKQALTLYIIADFDQRDELLTKLGKHTTSVSCLYVKRLSDIDMGVLRELATKCYGYMKSKKP